MNDRIIHKRSNSPNMKPIIEIKNLAAGYDGRTVLHDVNLKRLRTGLSGHHRSERRRQDDTDQVHPRSAETDCRRNHLPHSYRTIRHAPNRHFRCSDFPRLSATVQHHRPEVSDFGGGSDSLRTKYPEITDFPLHSRTEGERQTNHRPHGTRRTRAPFHRPT